MGLIKFLATWKVEQMGLCLQGILLHLLDHKQTVLLKVSSGGWDGAAGICSDWSHKEAGIGLHRLTGLYLLISWN